MSRTNRGLVLAVVALALLAGCSGGLTGDTAGDAGDGADGDGAAAAGGDGDGGRADSGDSDGGDGGSGGGSDGTAADRAAYDRQQRAVIRTGSVRLRVDEFDAARDRLVAVAEDRGGFVAASNESKVRAEGQRWTEGTVTIRVPGDEFPAAFREVKRLGTVVRSTSASKDVTDQLVDLEARIENLENRRDRLRTLYDEANTTDETLRIGTELSDVQERIERLRAERRALEDRVAYGTITVALTEPRPTPTPTPTATSTPTPEPAYHETSPGSAFLQSVEGVVVLGRTLVVTLAYLLPYLVTLGLPVGVAAAVYWRREELLGR